MPAFQDPEIYRDILDELQIGVSVLDLDRNIVFWSDGAEQVTGYCRIDVLGHSCSQNILSHCNNDACETCVNQCPMRTALHDAKAVEAASSIHHKAGYWVPVHIWAIPLRDRSGAIRGIIQTFEAEFAAHGPSPNDRSMKERGDLDDVTGLPSQTMMLARLRESLHALEQLQIPFGVVGIEVRDLAKFRGRFGQEAARSILEVLARTVRNTVWPTDFVGRWSEDRFLVMLSGCGEDALQAVAERVTRVAATASIHWWGEELSAAISVGHTRAIVGDTMESILHRAQDMIHNGQIVVPAQTLAAGKS